MKEIKSIGHFEDSGPENDLKKNKKCASRLREGYEKRAE